jgi:hypothetical protein
MCLLARCNVVRIYGIKAIQHDIRNTFLWPSTSLCFLTFCLTISVLKSTAMPRPKHSTSSIHAPIRFSAPILYLPSWLIFFLFLAQVGLRPQSAVFIFGSLSALARYWPFFGVLARHWPLFEVWLIVSLNPLSALLNMMSPATCCHC